MLRNLFNQIQKHLSFDKIIIKVLQVTATTRTTDDNHYVKHINV